MKKNLGKVLALIIVLVLIGYVGYGYYNAFFAPKKNPVVTMNISIGGEEKTVKMELYPEYAPNTVANFVNLVKSGYYNGKVFYGTDASSLYFGRDTEGSVVNATLSKVNSDIVEGSENDKEYEINGEFILNGFDANKLRHEKGVLSMCRIDYSQYVSSLTEQGYNSANSQVCIILNDESSFNGVYAGFGKVIEGMDVIEVIADLDKVVPENEEEAAAIEAFVEYPVIKSATVETYDVEYDVETHEPFDYYNYMYQAYSSYYGG